VTQRSNYFSLRLASAYFYAIRCGHNKTAEAQVTDKQDIYSAYELADCKNPVYTNKAY
jgi:lipopolysaccharide export system protein LptC